MNKGRIIQVGKPQEVYSHPVNTFVASFVGSPVINLIAGQVAGNAAVVSPGAFELPIAGGGREGRYTFGIRPEDVEGRAGRPGCGAGARYREPRHREGGDAAHRGNPGAGQCAGARRVIGLEDEVRFGWNAEKVMLFDADSGVNIRAA